MPLWCMKSKTGKMLPRTLSTYREVTLLKMFDEMPEAFQTKHWKNVKSSTKAYKELGYAPVRVKIVEERHA